MSNKHEILELLRANELTVKEIADKTEFNENEVRVYIHRLLEDNLIKEIGKKKRWIIYSAIEKTNNHEPIKLLKELYEFMGDYMSFREDKINEIKQKRDLLQRVREMVANA